MNAVAFSRDDVCAIHSAAIARFGGLDGVRDEGMLASALASPSRLLGVRSSTRVQLRKRVGTLLGSFRGIPSWMETSELVLLC